MSPVLFLPAMMLMASCANRALQPLVLNNSNEVGWRNLQKREKAEYSPIAAERTTLLKLSGNELISVKPTGFCTLSKPKLLKRNVLRFDLDGCLYDSQPTIMFAADKQVKITVGGKENYALPSSSVQVGQGTNLSGTIWARLPRKLSHEKDIHVQISLGDDIHEFVLTSNKDDKTDVLALVPYYPIWSNQKPKPKPKENKETVHKVEEITYTIRKDLKKDLDTFLQELQQRKELTANTQVDVNAEVIPEINSQGNLEYNMKVRYDVQVLNSLKKMNINSQTDDWAAGKYLLRDSKAALQTAGIIKKSVENKLEEYIVPGTKISVKIIGSTDASPFRSTIPYESAFGNIVDREYFVNGSLGYITITPQSGIYCNEQLAYLRTLDIAEFMKNHIGPFRIADCNYEHFAEVASEKGAEYRRVAVEITIHDAFSKKYPEIAPDKNENVFEQQAEVDVNIPKTQMEQPDAIAVIIGNAQYNVAIGKQGTTKVGPVRYAINDASVMKKYMVNTLGIPESNIIYKTNADKKDFDEIFGNDSSGGTLSELADKVKAKTVYFFYSGHGYPFMGESYLLGVHTNPKSCKEQATSVNHIYKKLEQLNVDNINVMLDACFSGQGIQMEASATEIARRPKPDKLAKFIILSASNEEQYANWYTEKKHGLFSYVLMKAMQDFKLSDKNSDGILTFEELYDYVSNDKEYGVPYLTRELEGEQVRQNPLMQGSKRVKQAFVKY